MFSIWAPTGFLKRYFTLIKSTYLGKEKFIQHFKMVSCKVNWFKWPFPFMSLRRSWPVYSFSK